MSDLRAKMALRNPRRQLLPCRLHIFGVQRKLAEPESIDGTIFRVQRANVELVRHTSCRSVCDQVAAEFQTPHALAGMIAAKHVEDSVDAVAVRGFTDMFFVVDVLVVDR